MAIIYEKKKIYSVGSFLVELNYTGKCCAKNTHALTKKPRTFITKFYHTSVVTRRNFFVIFGTLIHRHVGYLTKSSNAQGYMVYCKLSFTALANREDTVRIIVYYKLCTVLLGIPMWNGGKLTSFHFFRSVFFFLILPPSVKLLITVKQQSFETGYPYSTVIIQPLFPPE